jgi:DUF2914 family protein
MKHVWLVLWLLPALAIAEDEKPADKPAASASSGTEVLSAKLGTGVKDREVEGEGTSFKADVGHVYLWLKVKGQEGSKITVAWYKGDEDMGKVDLTLKHATMRTWASKTIAPDMKGDWRADILGPDGAVLQTVKFTIEG